MTTADPAHPLDRLLSAAADGHAESLRPFFEALLRAELLAPRRHQEHPLSDAPRYPNELFDFLAVESGGRVTIPVFTHPTHLASWCGLPLTVRPVSMAQLCAVVPEGWWLVLNPGSGVEKDFSPWELDQLRHDFAGVEEIIAELALDTSGYQARVRFPRGEFFETIAEALHLWGEKKESVVSLKCVEEISVEADSEQDIKAHSKSATPGDKPTDAPGRLVVGVFVNPGELEANLTTLKAELSAALGPLFVGQELPRILVRGIPHDESLLGIMQMAPAIYSRSTSESSMKRIFAQGISKWFGNSKSL